MYIVLFLLSLTLYGVFVYAVTSRRLLPPLAGPRRNTSAVSRCVTALIVWPLLGFCLFWLGVFMSAVGGVILLPISIGWRVLAIL